MSNVSEALGGDVVEVRRRRPAGRGSTWRSRAVWGWVVFSATVIGLFSMRYVLPKPPMFLVEMKNHFLHPQEITFHAVAGSIALMVGPWQLWPGLRAAHPNLHRWLGRIYLADVLVACLFASLLVPTVTTGFPAASAFATLGIVWAGSAALGFLAILRRDVQAHRRWMLRSFAMAFAAVTIRFYFHPARALGIPFAYTYPASLWLSLMTNLVMVELLLRWPAVGAAISVRQGASRKSGG
jgi:hypothetical protein